LNGISRQFFVPYTQQNGVSKQKNKTLVEVVLSMFHSIELTQAFWGEAILIDMYLKNKQLNKTVDNLSPYELWTCVSFESVWLHYFCFNPYRK
jgi:hypothetical protein